MCAYDWSKAGFSVGAPRKHGVNQSSGPSKGKKREPAEPMCTYDWSRAGFSVGASSKGFSS